MLVIKLIKGPYLLFIVFLLETFAAFKNYWYWTTFHQLAAAENHAILNFLRYIKE